MSDKNLGGKPPIFENNEQLETKINEYFEHIKGELREEREVENSKGVISILQIWNREPEPPTITGLALFLGFKSRQSILDYEKKGEYSCTIKSARLRVENHYEKSLNYQSATGAIFALKNFGWSDKQEFDHTTGGEKINSDKPKVVINFKKYKKDND